MVAKSCVLQFSIIVDRSKVESPVPSKNLSSICSAEWRFRSLPSKNCFPRSLLTAPSSATRAIVCKYPELSLAAHLIAKSRNLAKTCASTFLILIRPFSRRTSFNFPCHARSGQQSLMTVLLTVKLWQSSISTIRSSTSRALVLALVNNAEFYKSESYLEGSTSNLFIINCLGNAIFFCSRSDIRCMEKFEPVSDVGGVGLPYCPVWEPSDSYWHRELS